MLMNYGFNWLRCEFMCWVVGFGVGVMLFVFLYEINVVMVVNKIVGNEQKYLECILVVLEFSGGNDGFNIVVLYINDEYYCVCLMLVIWLQDVFKVDDEFGFYLNLFGFESFFKDGDFVVVYGCSYLNLICFYFEVMKYWYIGSLNVFEVFGWFGWFVDLYQFELVSSYIVNVVKEQILVVCVFVYLFVVFDDFECFSCVGGDEQKEFFVELVQRQEFEWNEMLSFVWLIVLIVDQSFEFICYLCVEYKMIVDYGYGEIGIDMKKIIVMIVVGLLVWIYYMNFGSFDMYVIQVGLY